jgi:hypothetical protein
MILIKKMTCLQLAFMCTDTHSDVVLWTSLSKPPYPPHQNYPYSLRTSCFTCVPPTPYVELSFSAFGSEEINLEKLSFKAVYT